MTEVTWHMQLNTTSRHKVSVAHHWRESGGGVGVEGIWWEGFHIVTGGKESACQCAETAYIPDLGRFPQAVEQISPCTTISDLCPRAKEPQLLSPHATTTEDHSP